MDAGQVRGVATFASRSKAVASVAVALPGTGDGLVAGPPRTPRSAVAMPAPDAGSRPLVGAVPCLQLSLDCVRVRRHQYFCGDYAASPVSGDDTPASPAGPPTTRLPNSECACRRMSRASRVLLTVRA